jgi:iron complex outermembrane receptor protein
LGPTVTVSTSGNPDFASEEVIAWELGYRAHLFDRLSLDVAGFYNRYRDLRTTTAVAPFTYQMINAIEGDTYGLELAADGDLTGWWRLKLAYTYLKIDLDETDSFLSEKDREVSEGEVPRHQLSLRSLMNLGGHWTLDTWLRWVDDLPSQGVDAYAALDVRLGWRPAEHLEFSLVGQNLLERRHAEFVSEHVDVLSTEVPRSVYGKVTWSF